MCYHNKLSKSGPEVEDRYEAKFEQLDLYKPIHHTSGFSHPLWPVITTEDPKAIKLYSWGLIPQWAKPGQVKDLRISTLNAKSETIFDLPSFRSSIGKKRCIIPSDGFYEWMDLNKVKYPHHIGVKSTEIFSLAGIYESWIDKEGKELNTFSIITTEANNLMAKIHNVKKRMPLILSKESEKHWIDPGLSKEEIKGFFKPYPEDDMEAYTISKLITSRKENSNQAKVYERFEYEELK